MNKLLYISVILCVTSCSSTNISPEFVENRGTGIENNERKGVAESKESISESSGHFQDITQ